MKTIHKGMLAALFVLAPALAFSNPVHSIWTTKPIAVADPAGWYTPASGNAVISWNEATGQAFVNARAVTTSNDVFEFQLIQTSANTTSYDINGSWNIYKNGALVCGACQGSAYGLTATVGSGFKIYVANSTYHFSGNVASRFDY